MGNDSRWMCPSQDGAHEHSVTIRRGEGVPQRTVDVASVTNPVQFPSAYASSDLRVVVTLCDQLSAQHHYVAEIHLRRLHAGQPARGVPAAKPADVWLWITSGCTDWVAASTSRASLRPAE